MSLYRKQDGRSSEGVTPAEGNRSGKTMRPAGGHAGGAAKPVETAQGCSGGTARPAGGRAAGGSGAGVQQKRCG